MKIVAYKINKTHIFVKCPFCFSKYKKNGEPYKTARNLIHLHGSCGDLSNRIEHRCHHSNNNKNKFEWEIEINDYTIRE